ncbi:gamma-aminobutyric acid receptor subunit alpha-2 [Striga asiatica]|uniref:Gamma-aminobutyric acid receptor subunit alpha-2 n=1 Tax=Striga asiatica TaxID=4170 RepID=A0A5A7PKI5_STRAF|nr:gamma-aminobutyric acid receptor subunit alpha-2 [Striga asiatica]
MQSPDEWARKYQEMVSTRPDLTLDQEASDIISHSALSPKASIGKPGQRRSRASKRAPTTLLNANANNFRALVQKFTGCQSESGNYKGPINLNFAQYKADQGSQLWYENSQLGQSSSEFSSNDAVTATANNIPVSDDRDHGSFVSTADYDMRSDSPLSFADFDLDKFSKPEDYPEQVAMTFGDVEFIW